MDVRDDVVKMFVMVIMRCLRMEMVMTKACTAYVQGFLQKILGVREFAIQMLDQPQFVE